MSMPKAMRMEIRIVGTRVDGVDIGHARVHGRDIARAHMRVHVGSWGDCSC